MRSPLHSFLSGHGAVPRANAAPPRSAQRAQARAALDRLIAGLLEYIPGVFEESGYHSPTAIFLRDGQADPVDIRWSGDDPAELDAAYRDLRAYRTGCDGVVVVTQGELTRLDGAMAGETYPVLGVVVERTGVPGGESYFWPIIERDGAAPTLGPRTRHSTLPRETRLVLSDPGAKRSMSS